MTRKSATTTRGKKSSNNARINSPRGLGDPSGPASARSISEALIIKDGDLFFLSERDGNIPLGGMHAFGLYHHDCRFLSGYEITLNKQRPSLLVATAINGYQSLIELTNPEIRLANGKHLQKETISIKWERIVEPQILALHDAITIENFNSYAVELDVTLAFEAGFKDVFEVRGFSTTDRAEPIHHEWYNGTLRFLCEGRDRIYRTLTAEFTPRLQAHRGTQATFSIRLRPRERKQIKICLTVGESKSLPQLRRRKALSNMADLHQGMHDSLQEWMHGFTEICSDNQSLEVAIRRSLLDLRLLRSHLRHEHYICGGLPWFGTLFGRDSIIASLQTLAYQPDVAAETLRLLASYQGKRVDDWRDEQPGKILHELRLGELAHIGQIPQTPYYGSVDVTMLFLILMARHASWTGDLTVFNDLRANVDLALDWMANYGDLDGDGYIEYLCLSKKGLRNQGWKDSGDGIVNSDGSLAQPPIALVEVQAYAYAAKVEIAELFRRTGEVDRARQLENDAEGLRKRFNQDFWSKDLKTYILARQAKNRPVAVVSSNPGHALWVGIADSRKARGTMQRLMADDMFTGWGIRTLSANERRFNPVGYHLGTVWPHDNSIIAAGFRRYGFDKAALRLFSGLLDASRHFRHQRLPELFCGFRRDEYDVPVNYPVACHPQAWASGSLPYLLETTLGLIPNAFESQLRIVRPLLPPHAEWIEVRNLRVANARVDLRLDRTESGKVEVTVLKTSGELDIKVEHETSDNRDEYEKKAA